MTVSFENLAEFHDTVYRNIQGLTLGFSEFADLTDDTDAHRLAERQSSHIPDRYTASDLQFQAIDYIFVQKTWLTSRFGNGSFPVWYSSHELNTTFYETSFHWKRIYLHSPQFPKKFTQEPISTLRTVFTVQCNAALIDLRAGTLLDKNLVQPDPQKYAYTQQIGLRIHREGYPGLITKSARQANGENLAVLKKEILSNPTCFNDYIYEFNNDENKFFVKNIRQDEIILSY